MAIEKVSAGCDTHYYLSQPGRHVISRCVSRGLLFDGFNSKFRAETGLLKNVTVLRVYSEIGLGRSRTGSSASNLSAAIPVSETFIGSCRVVPARFKKLDVFINQHLMDRLLKVKFSLASATRSYCTYCRGHEVHSREPESLRGIIYRSIKTHITVVFTGICSPLYLIRNQELSALGGCLALRTPL
jgi:hypothetical protein